MCCPTGTLFLKGRNLMYNLQIDNYEIRNISRFSWYAIQKLQSTSDDCSRSACVKVHR